VQAADPYRQELGTFSTHPARSDDMSTQSGIVKWFNESKGFGFISPDNGGKDLFAHLSEIHKDADIKVLTENQRVEFEVTEGRKGLQASNIRPLA
jgi:cold shock protein